MKRQRVAKGQNWPFTEQMYGSCVYKDRKSGYPCFFCDRDFTEKRHTRSSNWRLSWVPGFEQLCSLIPLLERLLLEIEDLSYSLVWESLWKKQPLRLIPSECHDVSSPLALSSSWWSTEWTKRQVIGSHREQSNLLQNLISVLTSLHRKPLATHYRYTTIWSFVKTLTRMTTVLCKWSTAARM